MAAPEQFTLVFITNRSLCFLISSTHYFVDIRYKIKTMKDIKEIYQSIKSNDDCTQ